MNAILNDRTYTDSYLAIKDARVTVASALDRMTPGQLHDPLRDWIAQCLTVARRVSTAQRRLATRTRDASDALPAAEALSELDLLQRSHMQRSRPDAAIGPAEMDALEREFKRLLLLIVEMVNAAIRMIARLFGVDLPLIDAAPIRTAVYGNDAYRKARHGDASLVEAAAEVMQQDYQSARGSATDRDEAVVSAEVIRQVRDCIRRNGGATDRIDEERRAYLDDLAPAERAILTHASGNQIVEHLYRHTPIDGVRPFAGRGNTMTI